MTTRYRLAARGVHKYDDADPHNYVAIQPEDGAEWDLYHQWLADPSNQLGPPLAPPAPEPSPVDGHNFVAAGVARQQRVIERLARTDPLKAALLKGGIKT